MDERRNENYGGWLSQPPMRAAGIVVRVQGSGFSLFFVAILSVLTEA